MPQPPVIDRRIYCRGLGDHETRSHRSCGELRRHQSPPVRQMERGPGRLGHLRRDFPYRPGVAGGPARRRVVSRPDDQGARRLSRHNCGGRCLLSAHVKDGVITRLETDDRPRRPGGRSAAARLRARPRLPPPPVPPRPAAATRCSATASAGEGRFERISWDEALDSLAGELTRVKDDLRQRRPLRALRHRRLQPAQRLADRDAGCSTSSAAAWAIYNSYSWACIEHRHAVPSTARSVTGNQRQDWLNSQLHPDVGLESGGDARRHQQRLLRQAGARAGRAGRLHRSRA